MNIRPFNSPPCWGDKYQDGEKECEQCNFNDTCRPAMLNRITGIQPPARNMLPVLRNYPTPVPPPPPPQMAITHQQTMVPLPSRPYVAPPVSTLPKSYTPSVATQVAQPTNPTYYQSSTGFSIPDHRNPNPLTALHRPGAPAPSYFITQHPGESVGLRVFKNVVLRALEAIFSELMQFFRHWTWPKAV